MGGVRRRVLQASLRDLVEAVRRGRHVLVHAVQEGVGARTFGRLTQFEAAAGTLAMFPAPLGILRVTREGSCHTDEGKR